MNPAIDTDVWLLAPYQTEWAVLCANRHNVLIEGPVGATHAVLLLLQPHIRHPIVWKPPQERFELPRSEAGTLILDNVATLTPDDQATLLARLDDRASGAQIVSMTEQPLFPLVARGLFSAALYYRLNVVLLRV